MSKQPNPDPHTRIGAYAVCVDDDRMLLTRIWEGDVDAGRWNLPGGGIDFGESLRDGLARELYEETGLAGEVVGLLDVIDRVFPPWQGWGPLHAIAVVYSVAATGEPRVVEIGGTTVEARWVPLDEVASLPLTPLAAYGIELLARLPS